MSLRATATYRPRNNIGQFIDSVIGPAVKAGVHDACQMIEERAKGYCPVDTGALRDSISSDVEELTATIRGTVSAGMYYAPYVEFGTGKRGAESAGAGPGPYKMDWPGMAAQPFMRPALDESRDDVMAIFSNDLGLAVK